MLFDSLPRPSVQVAPGVAHIPNWLDTAKQRELLEEFQEIAWRYAGSPMAMVRPKLQSGQMSVHQLHLGRFWDYASHRYVDVMSGTRVPAMSQALRDIAAPALHAAAAVAEDLAPWADSYSPEAALINYYPPGASMGMHVDAFEESAAPVISLSIGDEALFRIGGSQNRNKPWDEVTLCSGDLIVFGGPKRYAYHGIVRVNEHTLPADCGLREGRINITIRQVSDGNKLKG